MRHTRRMALSLFAAPAFLKAATQLRAGAATANISPALGTSLAGFMTDRKTADVHDELLVRCAALESGSTRALLAAIDSCMVPRLVLDELRGRIARENSIDPACVLFSSTHTHSAPPSMHLFQSLPDPAYIDLLKSRLADAARMAFSRLRPARLGFGVGHEPTLVFNRRYLMKEGSVPTTPLGVTTDKVQMNPPYQSPNILRPAGPTDPDHPVLAALSEDGRPIFVYASYAFHYAGFNPANHASSDYFGAWARRIERELGDPCVAILANGCAANINGIDFTRPAPSARDYTVIERTAAILAFETLRTLKSISYLPDVQIKAAIENVPLAIRRPSPQELQQAIQRVGENPGNEFKDRADIYARESVFLSRYPAQTPSPVQALRIGDTAFATFPGETFVELGLAIKAKKIVPHTATISIANDACGYIPTVEAFEQGGYETWRAKSSCVEKDAATKLSAALESALNKTA
jgi:neutral ceramidase